ncbi:putative DNA-binding domain-containing protein [Francisellaceae bacterium]|nr:putative DNA-binding domain-containing protein [Francisellaceae bacterium]
MSNAPDFQNTQKTFIDNIRKAEQSLESIPNMSNERMQVYKELVYHNIESTARKTFPVITNILSKAEWHDLVKTFIETQELKSPYFHDISKSFVDYLSDIEPQKLTYPFLAELAHYEWIELDVELDQSETLKNDTQHSLDDAIINVSPTTRILTYDFPVHKISKENIIIEKPEQPTFLVVYRTLDFEVKFLEINMLSACLLEQMQAKPDTLDNTLLALSQLLNIPLTEPLKLNSKAISSRFIAQNILYR